MSIEKNTYVDRIEVVDLGVVQVRTKTAIMENGKEIGGSLRRHVIAPGDDYSQEDARVQAICAATHTPEVVAEYAAAQAG